MQNIRPKNLKYMLLAIILAAGLLSASGCILFQFPTPAATATPTPVETPAGSPIDPAWAPQISSQASFLPSIADVVAAVRSSVVAINTEVVTYDIFNMPSTERGAGSGWIIDASGLIVTNNHVVEGAESVSVTLSDGRAIAAETIRTDPVDDIAVIRINASGLTPIKIGDSANLRVGDWVVAIGNPLGLGISAKEGIVSRVGVAVDVSDGQTLYNLIETSAAINPGNSGGPLVNMAGEVIGITSIKVADVGVEGLGYAINISDALPIAEELIKTGRVIRPWLGVSLLTVDEGIATRYDLSVQQGALVTNVGRGSPADRAGLQAGDVIVTFNGKNITSTEELVRAIRASQIGQNVSIAYWRGQSQSTTTATLAESPAA